MSEKIRAIGMLSGGLDSTLALEIMKRQGIEVIAVNFYTGFCITETHRRSGWKNKRGEVPRNEALVAAADVGVEVELIDIAGADYNRMLLDPRYGYGKNVNPCIDCRIFMFERCKALMAERDARFVFTGEVLGQRPKSQRFHTLRLIERASGLEGLIVRPLSARMLPPTIPEQEGWLDRAALYDITGRSRTRQMALARELGLASWPSPAGGCCFLTDENYARKFRDLVSHTEDAASTLTHEDFLLLAIGRRFRLDEQVVFMVGRDEGENAALQRLARGGWLLDAEEVPGPTALVLGEPDDAALERVAAVVAGYGKGRDQPRVTVVAQRGELRRSLEVAPERGASVDALRV